MMGGSAIVQSTKSTHQVETTNMTRFISVTASITIDEQEIDESFVRSPGPGGQNVNKVATAVQLRFPLAHTASLPDDVRARALKIAGKRVGSDGWLVIEASRHRSQARNRDDARGRLLELLRAAAVRPKPRRATRPTLASKERRLQEKRGRSQVKRQRSARNED
jgi:ribosome-associated protein